MCVCVEGGFSAKKKLEKILRYGHMFVEANAQQAHFFSDIMLLPGPMDEAKTNTTTSDKKKVVFLGVF